MKDNEHGPKLPVQQLAILAVARFAEPLAMTSVFPYLPEMIASFGVDEEDIARWAGLTSAVFSLAQAATAVPWGRASDRFGRKPVVMVGLIFTMVCFLIWGVSSSLTMAIIVRAIQGGSNGNVGIIRTMVAEMVPEKELQPRAYSVMPLVWSIGSIFGPAFGGFFSQPVKQFPAVFGNSEFFKKYPFALPNILGAIIFLASVTTGVLFLKETQINRRGQRDWGLVLGDKLTAPLCMAKRRLSRRYAVRDQDDEAATAPLLGGNKSSATTHGATDETDDDLKKKTTKKPVPAAKAAPTMKEVFTRQSTINLISYTFLALHSVAFDQVLPVFLHHPRHHTSQSTTIVNNNNNNPSNDDNVIIQLPFLFVDGFGISSGQIGTIFTLYGIVCGAVQFLVFPSVCSYFGVRRCFRFCVVLFPLVYLLTPYTVLIQDTTARFACLLVVMTIKACAVIFGFPCTTILLTNSADNLRVLGTLNGFATTFSALGRACGPALAGAAFSWGVKRGCVGLPWYLLAAIAIVGAVPSWMIVDGKGPTAEVEVVEEVVEGGEEGNEPLLLRREGGDSETEVEEEEEEEEISLHPAGAMEHGALNVAAAGTTNKSTDTIVESEEGEVRRGRGRGRRQNVRVQ